MIILGLLLVALICLVVGLVLPSTAWLIASLIASVGAGYVLFRARTLIAGAHAADGGAKTAVLDREPASEAATAAPRQTRAQTRAQARAAKAEAAAEAEVAEMDTPADSLDATATQQFPAHDAARDSAELAELPGAEVSGAELLGGVGAERAADEPAAEPTAEPTVPADEHAGDDVAQSHQTAAGHTAADDDFGSAQAAEGQVHEDVDVPQAQAEPVVADEGDVWVIDGRPRYHLATCAIIQGQDAEPIPFEQATEDGFMPCSLCEPNVLRATA